MELSVKNVNFLSSAITADTKALEKNRWEASAAAGIRVLLGMQEVLHSLQIEAPSSAAAIQKLTPPQPGEKPVIYHPDGRSQLKDLYLESIANAKKSVIIFAYQFSDEDFIRLLNRKAEEGVNVTLIIDKDHLQTLQRLGSSKLKIVTQQYDEGKIHEKMMAIDDERVWIGSADFLPSSLVKQHNTIVGVYQEDFALALRHEAEVFLGLRKREKLPPPSFLVGDQLVEFLPFPHVAPKIDSPEKFINEYGKRRIIEVLDNAKEEIRIIVPVWTNDDLMQAIIRAKKRGVKVEIMLGTNADNLKARTTFFREGIPYTMPSTDFHDKFFWVDKETFIVGSGNYSNSMFMRSDDSFVLVNDLTTLQNQDLEKHWYDLGHRRN